jgi:hypothetical protein
MMRMAAVPEIVVGNPRNTSDTIIARALRKA